MDLPDVIITLTANEAIALCHFAGNLDNATISDYAHNNEEDEIVGNIFQDLYEDLSEKGYE